MNPLFIQIVVLVVGTGLSLAANYLLIRWAQRQNIPVELRKDIERLGRDLVVVRGQIKYIQGRLNGKEWQREET